MATKKSKKKTEQDSIIIDGAVTFYTLESETNVRGDYRKQALLFTPNNIQPDIVMPVRCNGTLQRLSDGTAEFIEMPRKRSKTTLIKKLRHGRITKTQDGAFLLTLRIYEDEGIKMSTFVSEAFEAALAIENTSIN